MDPEILADMAARTNAKNWLETFAHKGSRNCAKYFASFECMEHRFRVFVDSGAFTVWCGGKTETPRCVHCLRERLAIPRRLSRARRVCFPGYHPWHRGGRLPDR